MKPLPLAQSRAVPISDQNNILVLSANTVETVPVPTGARYMVVSASAVAAFLFDADPPNVADTTNGSAGMIVQPNSPPLPIELPLPLPTNVRFNAPGTATVAISFYGPQ